MANVVRTLRGRRNVRKRPCQLDAALRKAVEFDVAAGAPDGEGGNLGAASSGSGASFSAVACPPATGGPIVASGVGAEDPPKVAACPPEVVVRPPAETRSTWTFGPDDPEI